MRFPEHPTEDKREQRITAPAIERWLWVGPVALLLLILLLGGCAGTVVEFSGQLCGQPVAFKMLDRKDRSAADIMVQCGEDGGVTITTAESSTSKVLEAQAAAISSLTAELGRRAALAATMP
jgi:hypothetical protein